MTKRQLRSLLNPWQRGLLVGALGVAIFMLANTIYLLLNRIVGVGGWDWVAPGDQRLTALFQWMILGHIAVGLLLAALMTFFFVTHLPTVWARRHRASILSGVGFVLVGAALVVTGLFILTAAASEANRWAWWTHVVTAALIPVGYGFHRMVSYVRPAHGQVRRFGWAVSVVTGALMVAHIVGARGTAGAGDFSGGASEVTAQDDGAGEATLAAFRPAAAVSPSSPFFPSGATTSSGRPIAGRLLMPGDPEDLEERVAAEVAERGFVVEAPIGAMHCDRCHADIVEQWSSSAHRFASLNNPFYEATVRDLRGVVTGSNPWVEEHLAEFPTAGDGVGRAKSKLCGACHDPAVMLAGNMGRPIDRRTPEAQAGLTCMACHAIDETHGVTGNGNYNIDDGQTDLYLFAEAAAGSVGAFLHDAAIRSRPAAHKRRLLKPFFRTGEYCAACHKVSLSEPVNNYRWLRGQDEYDSWHDSGISRNAARTFYLPASARVCQDCHMPPVPAPLGDLAARDGTVRSHRFVAANTALPFVRGDTAALYQTEAFLRDDRLRVDVFAVRRKGSDGGGDEVLAMPLDVERPTLAPGEVVTFDVVVRNLGVGHGFPGGTNDSNQGWLEVTVLDDRGQILGRSGEVGEDGRVDPMAHAYGAVMLDAEGRAILRRNGQDIHVTAATNVIGPGTADVGHYEVVVPRGLAGRAIVVRARLLWRKFNRAYTEFAFENNPEGFRGFDRVPELPITEIARDEVLMRVAAGEAEADGVADVATSGAGPAGTQDARGVGVEPWVRFNDYGIGLLLEGNTRLAERAFRSVADLEPARIDGALNLARTAIAAGNLDSAYAHLEQVEQIRSGDSRAAWVWGVVLQEDGRYEDAALAYRGVLEDFPEDRAAWRNLGRTLYLDQRADEAVKAFDRVLAIDPEDRISHYFRMLALRVSGRAEEAAFSEAAFTYYGIDESAQALTRAYREANPGVNLMAQSVHTHTLTGAR